MNQEILLKKIRQELPTNTSIIDVLATVLNISYDASHRRISLKSKFTIDETIKICQYFGFSMDAIFSGKNKVLVEKTKEVHSAEDMMRYFEQSANYLKQYENKEEVTLFYSAKDIPLFYTIDGALLSKFKLYVWLNLFSGINPQNNFESFVLTQPIQEYTTILQAVYATASVTEIWNDTTINSTLQQINYFFEAGLLSLNNALLLFDDVKNLLFKIEEKCNENKPTYHLYYNELLLLNNNVLLSKPKKQTLFVPYTLLGYFITEDKTTCLNAAQYYGLQSASSKSLNLSGTKDRKMFFNKAQQKVDFYIQKTKNKYDLEF